MARHSWDIPHGAGPDENFAVCPGRLQGTWMGCVSYYCLSIGLMFSSYGVVIPICADCCSMFGVEFC